MSRSVHQALVDACGVPPDDLFQVFTEHVQGGIMRPESSLGIDYSDRLTIVQITADDTCTAEQKKRLHRAIADNVARGAGLATEDVLISPVEVRKQNGSFGRGEAQYA